LAGRSIQQPELRIPPLRVAGGESSAANPVSDPRLRAALDYINAHHGQAVYTADLCRVARLPRRMLERRFQQLLGRSPNAHILRVRVARAKELLVTTNWPISRIAETCGFEAKKFAVRFRSQTGQTPTQYRAANRSR
jgi:transcriptional regulator GlxA family with amidase domain